MLLVPRGEVVILLAGLNAAVSWFSETLAHTGSNCTIRSVFRGGIS